MVTINQKMVNVLESVPLNEEISILKLSKKIGLAYTSVYRQVKTLSSFGAVRLNQKSNTQFVSVNFKKEITRILLSLSNYFIRQEIIKKETFFNLITKGFVFNSVLLLFGSHAQGKARKNSDIDLCAIGLRKNQEKVFKKKLRELELIHKKELNCLFFSQEEFISMLKSNSHNVGKEIVLKNIVLNNADLWYNLLAEVYDEIKL